MKRQRKSKKKSAQQHASSPERISMLQTADPMGERDWGSVRVGSATEKGVEVASLSGLDCAFSSPPYSSLLHNGHLHSHSHCEDTLSAPSLYGSFPSLIPLLPPSCSSASLVKSCSCVVKEGYVGNYLVRLSLLAATEPSGFPSLQLDVSQGENHILSHCLNLKPSPKTMGADVDLASHMETNVHLGNKKRKREEEDELILAHSQDGTSTSSVLPNRGRIVGSNPPLKHQKKQKLEEEQSQEGEEQGKNNENAKRSKCHKMKAETALVPHQSAPQSALQQQHEKGINMDTEENAGVGILSLPVELLQHIFLHVPIRQMARLNEVCKLWESVVDDSSFWRLIFKRYFGIPAMLRLSWKQRALACHRRAQIFELDLEGSIYGQLSWAAQFGYFQYFRNTIKKYSNNTKFHLKYKIDGDLVRFAASEGYGEIVESIMGHQDVISLRDTMRRTGLHHATKYGQMNVVKMLVPHDSNLIEEKDKYGDTPLILAACYGNKAVVEYLLANNAQVDGKNQDDYTPLIFASQNGHKDIVEILLKAGADVNARGNEGTSPLIIASQEGHTDVVRLLLSHNPDLNAQVQASGDTALILSVCYGHEEVVDLLLAHGANPNVPTVHGKTAVFFAASHGKHRMLEKLVKRGGEINIHAHDRVTPLIAAARGGHKDVVEYLLAQGAMVDIVDNYGNTALLLAVCHENTEVVQLLLPFIHKAQKEKAEHMVSEIQDEEPKEEIKPFMDTDPWGTGGYVRLWLGPGEKSEDTENTAHSQLLQALTDVNQTETTTTTTTTTATTTTTTTTTTSTMKLLDVKDRAGNSALIMAIKRKNKLLTQMLMENGADALKTFDANGLNALYLAAATGMADVLMPFLSPSDRELLSHLQQETESVKDQKMKEKEKQKAKEKENEEDEDEDEDEEEEETEDEKEKEKMHSRACQAHRERKRQGEK